MNTGILIIARLGSTRLSRKHLIEASEKTFMEWLIVRFRNEFSAELEKGSVHIVIATSDMEENRLFETLFADAGVAIFYGSAENIPLRQFECGTHFDFETIISVDGDDILCSPAAARKVFDKLNAGAAAAKTTGLPLGMNVMGYSTLFLEEAIRDIADQKTLETGWGRIFNEGFIEIIEMGEDRTNEPLRFTLDYPEDALFFQAVFDGLKEEIVDIDDKSLIGFVLKHKLNAINSSLNGEYWANFNAKKNSER